MTMFGWCMSGQHEGSGKEPECKGSFKRIYFGPVRKGRKTEMGLINTDETLQCECKCHKRGKK